MENTFADSVDPESGKQIHHLKAACFCFICFIFSNVSKKISGTELSGMAVGTAGTSNV